MSLFLALTIGGLVGLALMALPGLARGGHIGAAGHGLGHLSHGGGITHGAGHAAAGHAPAHAIGGQHSGRGGDMLRWLPSPRAIFSVMALFGAFGYAFVETAHLAPTLAGLAALVPALLIERFLVAPWWNRLLAFRGDPCASLDELTLGEAEAVTPFRNGRGIVSVVHDGRVVQLTASLPAGQAAMPVRVGDKLRIEEVDAANERVQVSLK